MEDIVEQRLAAFKQLELYYFEDRMRNVRYVLETLCESPLERLFFLELVEVLGNTAYVEYPSELRTEKDHNRRVALTGELVDWSSLWQYAIFGQGIKYEVQVIPQYEATVEEHNTTWKYRLDFLLRVVEDLPAKPTNLVVEIAVELDGHDFHERTKEQAQYDKRRDRHLQKLGFIVLRYTGSEVFNSAQTRIREKQPEKKSSSDLNRITREIIQIISTHITNRLRAYGHEI